MKKLFLVLALTILVSACESTTEQVRDNCRPHVDFSDQVAGDFACGFFSIFTLGYPHW